MSTVTLVKTYNDGITVNITKDGMDALASVLGNFIDSTDASTTEVLYNILMDNGADEHKYKVEVESNDLYEGDEDDTEHFIRLV